METIGTIGFMLDEQLPKGSHVIPFFVCCGFLAVEYSIQPNRELLWRSWASH